MKIKNTSGLKPMGAGFRKRYLGKKFIRDQVNESMPIDKEILEAADIFDIGKEHDVLISPSQE